MISSRTFLKKSRLTLLVIALLCSSWVLFAKNKFLNTLKGTQAKSINYINYEASGNATWQLKGDSPSFLEDQKISLNNPDLSFFGSRGDAKIKAQKAIISGNAKHCEMIGNVEAQYQEGQVVKTNHALIDLSSETVTFPGPFNAKDGKSKISASKGKLHFKPYEIITYGPSELEYQP